MDHGIANELFTKVLSRAADSSKSKSGLFGLLSDNSITLTTLLFSAVVVGLELLLSSTFFDCPLNNHLSYGVLFLVSPFFIVLIMNVLLVGNPWDVTDRCCINRYRRRSGECCYWVCPNLTKAFVGPCVWLIASFADTDYFVCAAVGQDIEKRNLSNVTEIKQLEAEFADAKALSLIAAWIVFLVFVVGLASVILIKKCCLKDNVLLEDEYIFDRREAIAALVTFRHFTQNGDPDSTTTWTENESGTKEDKVEEMTEKIQDKKETDNSEVEKKDTDTSPGTSTSGTGKRTSLPPLKQTAHFTQNGGHDDVDQPANPDSTTTRTENESGTKEDKVEKKNRRKKRQDEKKVDNREVEEKDIATSPGTSTSGTDTREPPPPLEQTAGSLIANDAAGGESNSGSTTITIEIEGTDGKKKYEDNKAGGKISWFKKLLGVKQDKEKDKKSDGKQGIVGRFMGKEEEITLYPEGIPEQRGKKWVEDQFKKGKRDLDVYKALEKMYPRVTRGRPWDPWVKKKNDGLFASCTVFPQH